MTKRVEVNFPPDGQGNVVLKIDTKTCNLNLVTTTVSAVFASFIPVAIGSTRPWRVWKPYVSTKWGVFPEQPIPEQIATW